MFVIYRDGSKSQYLPRGLLYFCVSPTNPLKETPNLLILDGHYSHTKNVDVLDKACENSATILS